MINYPHVAAMVFNTPLYATAEVISSVKTVLIPRMLGENLGLHKQTDDPQLSYSSAISEDREIQQMVIVDNIAIIPIHGVLVSRRGTIDKSCSELISYERLRLQVSAALNSDAVSEIVLDIHTGGGMAMGCKEFADFLYESRKEKTITAMVNFAAYSAGYYLAAACSRIICSPTGGVGSIGVIMETYEESVKEGNAGIKYTTFYRGDRKNDASPHEPLSEEAAAEINKRLDLSYSQFVDSVAKYRNIEVQKIIETQARLFSSEEALIEGLIDEIAPAQEAINSIAKRHQMPSPTSTIGIRAKAIDLTINI
jgi:signal peptide peptidase SppA